MATGWTCARCAAQNDETAFACQTCGLIRGGEVPASNAAPPAPAADPTLAPPPTSSADGSMPPPQSSSDPTFAPPPPSSWPEAGAVAPPPEAGAPAPGGWPGAPVAIAPTSAKKQVATGIFANVIVRIVLLLIVAGVIGGIALFTNAGRDANGTINKAGDLKPADLQVGDCYDLPGDSGTADASAVIDTTHATKCTDPHHYEVFYRGDMSMSAYPAKSDRQAWVKANCVPAFESYVGTTVDATTLTFYLFYPDDTGWAQGDRGAQCALADANGAALTGSMKGSKR